MFPAFTIGNLRQNNHLTKPKYMLLQPTQVIESFIGTIDHKKIKAGEIIFSEGESGEFMYGLIEGEIEVIVNEKVIELIAPGDVFGIGALVNLNQKRASTTKAKTDCTLILINREKFLFLIQETPVFALEVMRSYSNRLIKLKHSA